MIDSWENSFRKINRIQGLLVPGQEKFLYDAAAQLKRGSTIVEIGSFKGRSTACLGLGSKNKNTRIYAIDTFAGNDKDFYRGRQYTEKQYLDQFKKNLLNAGVKNVTPIQGFS